MRAFVKVFAISQRRLIQAEVQKVQIDAIKVNPNTVQLTLEITAEGPSLAQELCSHKDWEMHAISQILVKPDDPKEP